MKRRRVMVVGYGAIGRKVVALLAADTAFALGVMLREGAEDPSAVPASVTQIRSQEDVKEFAPDLIIEAAGHAVVRTHVGGWLREGHAVLLSSVGALHDHALLAELRQAAETSGGALLVCSGALAGVDYVNAIGAVEQTRIEYESRKPAAAWREELKSLGHDPDALDAPVILYQGDAAGAAARYPANLNVAATLALAAGGFDKIHVTVVADAAARGNSHSIKTEGPAGRMSANVVNAPDPDNPKTSALVAHAIAAAARRHFSPIRFV